MLGIPGDRRDQDQRDYGAIAAGAFDEVIVREDKNLRGRQPGETAANVLEGVREAKAAGTARATRAEKILEEMAAVRAALRRAIPGDLVVCCVDDAIAVYREAMAAAGHVARRDGVRGPGRTRGARGLGVGRSARLAALDGQDDQRDLEDRDEDQDDTERHLHGLGPPTDAWRAGRSALRGIVHPRRRGRKRRDIGQPRRGRSWRRGTRSVSSEVTSTGRAPSVVEQVEHLVALGVAHQDDDPRRVVPLPAVGRRTRH